MGLLRRPDYWAGPLNEMAQLMPPLGETVPPAVAVRVRQIACKTLGLVVDDPEFKKDVADAVGLAKSAFGVTVGNAPDYSRFLDAFMVLEHKILTDAGVNTVAVRDLDREIRGVASGLDPQRVDRVEDKIRYCRRLACDPGVADDPAKPLWQAAWRGCKGAGVLGIDIGSGVAATVTMGPAGAAAVAGVAALSCDYGLGILMSAIKQRW